MTSGNESTTICRVQNDSAYANPAQPKRRDQARSIDSKMKKSAMASVRPVGKFATTYGEPAINATASNPVNSPNQRRPKRNKSSRQPMVANTPGTRPAKAVGPSIARDNACA